MPRKKSPDSPRKPVPEEMADLPARLEQARKIRRLSWAEVSRRSSVDAGTLSRWSKGENWEGATGARFVDVAKALDVSLDWLLLGEEPMDRGVRDADFALFFEDSDRGQRAARALERRLQAVREEGNPGPDEVVTADQG